MPIEISPHADETLSSTSTPTNSILDSSVFRFCVEIIVGVFVVGLDMQFCGCTGS